MAAKIANRARGTKIEEDAELFVVVREKDNGRVYLGPGVPQAEAERLASTIQTPAKAVPADQVVNGYWVGEEAETTSE